MTKLLHTAHVLRKYDSAELGGTETHVAEITKRLPARGIACEVHAPAGPDDGDLLTVPIRRFRAFNPFLGSPAQRRALRANAGNLFSLDEPLRLALDPSLSLVHLHTAGRIGGGVRLAMKLTGRPYLVSVHGPMLSGTDFLVGDLAKRARGTLDLGKPYGLLVGARRVLDDAARVICFNDEEQREMEKRVGARAVRMDHGVDAARFAQADGARGRERWPKLGPGPIVLQVGRLCAQKDQLLGLRAFAAGAPPDHQLVLAGAETDRGHRAMLEAEALALGVRARVHLLGNVAPGEVPDLVAMSTICLAPSRHEAFGLLVLEAWAARRPVLFARVGGMNDLAQALGPDAPALAVRTPERWAEALAALLQGPEAEAARTRAVEQGVALLERRFNWDKTADALAALYRDVVGEAPRRAA